MSYAQLVTPDPDIPCEPGMCLQYVRETFGAPAVEPTAAAGWAAAQYKHEDQDFPDGWAPLWFAIPGVPAGHVVLRAPDGSIYSTSDESTVPHHHPTLEDLIWYYGPRVEPQYQLELQYLGWSEDISGVRVLQDLALTTESTEQDQPMSAQDVEDLKQFIAGPVVDEIARRTNAQAVDTRAENAAAITAAIAAMPAPDLVAAIPDTLVQAVAAGLAARLTTPTK